MGGQYGRPRCVYRDISEKSERLIKQGEQATNMYFPVGQNLCAGAQAYFYPPVPSGKFSLWQHRAIASASLRRLFAPLLPFEKPEIHTVFETVEKGLCPFLTKGLQSAARTSCPLTADKTHTCSLSCIFCQVHAPTENDQNPFAACGRQTLRGFFDSLESCMYFWFFKRKKWGKKTAETRRRNCAVVPYKISSFSFPETCPEFFPRFLSGLSASRHRHLP